MMLGGKDSSGSWRTMRAKEYPSLLCKILAHQFAWYNDTCEGCESVSSPEGLDEMVIRLGQWDPYNLDTTCTTMRQDYQPPCG